MLIFFVTSRCQGRCRSCFFWQGLNKKDDLSYAEIKRILPSIGRFNTLLLSGGEPFLRRDLVKICQAFIDLNGVRRIALPTNGLVGAKMMIPLKQLLTKHPRVSFSVNFSIDGPERVHDKLRGTQGALRRTLASIRQIERLRAKYRNVRVSVNTVLSGANQSELSSVIELVRELGSVDEHVFELLRGKPRSRSLRRPKLKQLRGLHHEIRLNARYYLRKDKGQSWLDKWASMGLLRYSQKVKERYLAGGGWPFPCLAGRNIGVIEPDGTVKLCELKRGVGKLRAVDYDFAKLWRSRRADALRETAGDGCACSHVCFINTSAGADSRSILAIPWHGLMGWLGR